MSEHHVFQTEVQELLQLVIHSLYSNRDIFLRELIANANDAIDKCRFEALTRPELSREWEVRIVPDEAAKMITVSDNGIGMNRDELINHLGTIAKSGTKAFLEQLKQSGETAGAPELIGQFGVGFYASFMVASKVEVLTRKAGETAAWRWTSEGNGSYDIEEAQRADAGTDIILHLREDASEYLSEWKIRDIVRKYADFVEHPVRMRCVHQKDGQEEVSDETLNSQKAIWRRAPSEVTDEEYDNFYSHLSHFGGKPLSRLHFSTEGATNFTALLYIPETAPFDFFYPEGRDHGLQLYVRRVFITDKCKELIPEYLRFVKGVVESNDLPLNVSREILQDNPHVRAISKAVVRKVLGELQTMLADRRADYEKFYAAFSRPLKEGLRSDYLNNDKIKDLLLFETLNNPAGKLVSLKEYVDAMPESQKEILYFLGESRTQIEASPLLEWAKARGFDVLLMTDTIDEWISADLGTYTEKSFKAVSKGEAELSDDEKKVLEGKAALFKVLTDKLAEILTGKVKSVEVTARLNDSPACLVRAAHDASAQLERFLKAMNQSLPEVKPVLEINPGNALIAAMLERVKTNPDDPVLTDYAHLVFDQATLAEGSPLADPVQFAKRLTDLMGKALSL